MKHSFHYIFLGLANALLLTAFVFLRFEPEYTQIIIDGNASDWEKYPPIVSDAEGDHRGGEFDIAEVRAFTNDQFFYLLIETYGLRQDYVHLDLEIQADKRLFVVSFNPEMGNSAFMGEVTTGDWQEIGEIAGSFSAGGEVVEFKMPLTAFGTTAHITLTDVRPMAGECCGENWNPVDGIDPVDVPHLDELEPEHTGQSASDSNKPTLCATQIEPPLPFGAFESASLQFNLPGFSAEWFVAPGVFNMPMELLLTPAGEILVFSVRSQSLHQLEGDGSISTIAEHIGAYFGDIDSAGNIYLYGFPGGEIHHITPDGKSELLVQSADLQTACDSGFAIGPDGNLYIAHNPCSDLGSLIRVSLDGSIETLARRIPWMTALRTTPDGRLLGAGYRLYEISLDDFSVTSLTPNPVGNISPGGMAFDDSGNIYLSTGSREQNGQVFRIDANGEKMLLADIPDNGLSGIEWIAETNEIIGGQLVKGGVMAVGQDGELREIIAGNGLNSPMGMAFSPCGELVVANDDAGMMALIDPAGKVSWFFSYVSFTPPTPFLAFAPEGTFYVSEAAPGMPQRVSVVSPEGELTPWLDAAMPSGLVMRSDGVLFVAETSAGRITKIFPDGATEVLVDGLQYPQDVVIAPDDSIYVIVGPSGFTGDDWFTTPNDGDQILHITTQGDVSTIAKIPNVTALAVDTQGNLFAAAGPQIFAISPSGVVDSLVSGLQFIRGMAFDLAGNLYASDADLNGIIRISGFPQGTLSGSITNESGAPVEGARLQVQATTPNVLGQVIFSDAQGSFNLPVAPGEYVIKINAEGFAPYITENIRVVDSEDTLVKISVSK